MKVRTFSAFWSSVDLTGNQTTVGLESPELAFWSSVDLTGNQTLFNVSLRILLFWSSVDLTGNQTRYPVAPQRVGFGAVSI